MTELEQLRQRVKELEEERQKYMKDKEDKMPKVSPLKVKIISQGRIQADVAQEAGISESRLSRIVNGRCSPTEYERKHLARILGVAREELPA